MGAVEVVYIELHYLLPGETEARRVLRIPASALRETDEDHGKDKSLSVLRNDQASGSVGDQDGEAGHSHSMPTLPFEEA